jgi:hypothetical protein
VYGAVPPIAVMVTEYAAPWVAGGSELGCSVKLNCANAGVLKAAIDVRTSSPQTKNRPGRSFDRGRNNMHSKSRIGNPQLRGFSMRPWRFMLNVF